MDGFTQLCIIVLVATFALFLLYEKIVRPYFVSKEGARIDADTDKDGTLTNNKNKLNKMKLDDVSSSSSDHDDDTGVVSAPRTENERMPRVLTEIPEADSDHENVSERGNSKQ